MQFPVTSQNEDNSSSHISQTQYQQETGTWNVRPLIQRKSQEKHFGFEAGATEEC